MKPDPLIQKLFAIERAIGTASLAELKAMVIEAQESAIQAEHESLKHACVQEYPQLLVMPKPAAPRPRTHGGSIRYIH